MQVSDSKPFPNHPVKFSRNSQMRFGPDSRPPGPINAEFRIVWAFLKRNRDGKGLEKHIPLGQSLGVTASQPRFHIAVQNRWRAGSYSGKVNFLVLVHLANPYLADRSIFMSSSRIHIHNCKANIKRSNRWSHFKYLPFHFIFQSYFLSTRIPRMCILAHKLYLNSLRPAVPGEKAFALSITWKYFNFRNKSIGRELNLNPFPESLSRHPFYPSRIQSSVENVVRIIMGPKLGLENARGSGKSARWRTF